MSTPNDAPYKLTQAKFRILNKTSIRVVQDTKTGNTEIRAKGTNINAQTKHIRQKV